MQWVPTLTHKTKNTNVHSQSANWPWRPTSETKLICSVTVWYIVDRKENQLGIWTTHQTHTPTHTHIDRHTHTHTRPKVGHLPTTFHWLRPAGEHQQRRELSAVKRLCYLLSSHHQCPSTTDTSVRHIVPVWMDTVRVWPGRLDRYVCLQEINKPCEATGAASDTSAIMKYCNDSN